MILARNKYMKLEFIPAMLMAGIAIERDYRYTNIAIAIPFFLLIFELKRDWRGKLL
jgi:hypothetical protein